MATGDHPVGPGSRRTSLAWCRNAAVRPANRGKKNLCCASHRPPPPQRHPKTVKNCEPRRERQTYQLRGDGVLLCANGRRLSRDVHRGRQSSIRKSPCARKLVQCLSSSLIEIDQSWAPAARLWAKPTHTHAFRDLKPVQPIARGNTRTMVGSLTRPLTAPGRPWTKCA